MTLFGQAYVIFKLINGYLSHKVSSDRYDPTAYGTSHLDSFVRFSILFFFAHESRDNVEMTIECPRYPTIITKKNLSYNKCNFYYIKTHFTVSVNCGEC